MDNFIELQKLDYSIIGKDCIHKGDFTFNGTTYISGQIEGTIHLNEHDHITINPTGVVLGSIHCGDITIKGQFNGDLFSSGSVILEPTANVKGRIKSRNLVVSPGAVLNIEGAAEEA